MTSGLRRYIAEHTAQILKVIQSEVALYSQVHLNWTLLYGENNVNVQVLS